MSKRFYTNKSLCDSLVTLTDAEAKHLTQVMRFEEQDEITLFNGDGFEYRARIETIDKKSVLCVVVEKNLISREIGGVVHVGSALPKADRVDFLIEKLTELGATDFTPLECERSVNRPRRERTEKLQRAVIEASKQCGRNMLMRIHEPVPFSEWCQRDYAQIPKSIAVPAGSGQWHCPKLCPAGMVFSVGPEGGFTERETGLAFEFGWRAISLGPRILRIETAAIALVAQAALSITAGVSREGPPMV